MAYKHNRPEFHRVRGKGGGDSSLEFSQNPFSFLNFILKFTYMKYTGHWIVLMNHSRLPPSPPKKNASPPRPLAAKGKFDREQPGLESVRTRGD